MYQIMPALTKLDIALSVPTPYDVSKCLSGMKCESIATFRLHWQRLEPGFQSLSMGVGIFGVVTHSGLFRGHPSPGAKIRNDTFGTYFLVQQLTTTQWHIIWLDLSIVKPERHFRHLFSNLTIIKWPMKHCVITFKQFQAISLHW